MSSHRTLCLTATLTLASLAIEAAPLPAVTALVGATVIDGNGGPAVQGAVVTIENGRVSAVGPLSSVPVPKGARIIDLSGKYVVPGLVDTNAHLSLYGGINERYETLVRYQSRQEEIVLEAAQLQLKHGVTTVRDSYGALVPLTRVREAIARGEAVGARILAAGNIVGWGGPYSLSFNPVAARGLTRFQEEMNDFIAQGAGEELMGMTLPELRAAIATYLGKGPDFLKYGGTSHFAEPTFIGFSPEAQRVIVEETHQRGRLAETHATTPESVRLAVQAGIDLIQHPEIVDSREIPDELVALLREKGVICSMLSNTITGEAWSKHLKSKEEAERKKAAADKALEKAPRPRTSAELRQQASDLGVPLEVRRANAQKLIQAGCRITVGTDNYWAAAPELAREPKPEAQDHGIGTLLGVEGLVELGMTPGEAIVAATRNGAAAAQGSREYGTIEPGKRADLVVLDANPLADIRNIRSIRMVVKDGRIVDPATLPEKPVLTSSRPVPEAHPRLDQGVH